MLLPHCDTSSVHPISRTVDSLAERKRTATNRQLPQVLIEFTRCCSWGLPMKARLTQLLAISETRLNQFLK